MFRIGRYGGDLSSYCEEFEFQANQGSEGREGGEGVGTYESLVTLGRTVFAIAEVFRRCRRMFQMIPKAKIRIEAATTLSF